MSGPQFFSPVSIIYIAPHLSEGPALLMAACILISCVAGCLEARS